MSSAWWSEIGLLLDLAAFVLLSIDLVRSLSSERQGRDELISLERRVWSARYGVFAPNADKQERQNRDFEARIAERIKTSERSMATRRWTAYSAILLAAIGFVLQIYGGWPSNGL